MAKDDLKDRLLAVESGGNGITTNWHRNPDGPEAAARIADLEAENARLVNLVIDGNDQIEKMTVEIIALEDVLAVRDIITKGEG